MSILRLEQANKTVKKYSLISGASGFVPVPFFDAAAITTSQLIMLKELSDQYGVKFSSELGKKLIASLLGGMIATNLAFGTAGAMLRSIPVVGWTLGVATMPAFGAAATMAVGRVFVMHFESGGTLLDFDPEAMRTYFQEQYKAA